MTLEEAIARHAREGRLSLTVFPASTGYQANLSLDGKGWRVEMADDPVVALKKVLGVLPGAAGPALETPSAGVFD